MRADVAEDVAAKARQLKRLVAEARQAAPLGHRQLIQQSVVPTAECLAAALQQCWALPEQVEAAGMEAAHAAATRSCAYLRCSNLGLEGGAAAGQGAGSLKCAGCRSVWYCGTACSHADWRAGHKRVCKTRAAARQQQREQQVLS